VGVRKTRGRGKGTAKKGARRVNDRGRRTAEKAAKKATVAGEEEKDGNPATKTAKVEGSREKTPKDFAEVRRNIANLVRASASTIAKKAIKLAEDGQLAQVKYLFEAVGLYPPTADTAPRPEDSLAYALLKRMGLPTEPVIWEEDEVSATAAGAVNPAGEKKLVDPGGERSSGVVERGVEQSSTEPFDSAQGRQAGAAVLTCLSPGAKDAVK